MKSFLAALVVMAALTAGAAWLLDTRLQETTEQRFTTTGVRLDPTG